MWNHYSFNIWEFFGLNFTDSSLLLLYRFPFLQRRVDVGLAFPRPGATILFGSVLEFLCETVCKGRPDLVTFGLTGGAGAVRVEELIHFERRLWSLRVLAFASWHFEAPQALELRQHLLLKGDQVVLLAAGVHDLRQAVLRHRLGSGRSVEFLGLESSAHLRRNFGVLLAGVLDFSLDFDFDVYELYKGVTHGLLHRPPAVICSLPLHPHTFSGKFEPSFEGDLVVHLRQERIKPAGLVDQLIVDAVLLSGSVSVFYLVLRLLGHQKDMVLRPQLKYLHLSAQFHATELLAHASVEELVEENVAVVALDAHLQNVLLQLVSRDVFVKAERVLLVVVAAQLPEEHLQLILFDFVTPISLLREYLPDSVKLVEVILEALDRVVLCQVVFVELLDDDQDEQLQHDVGAHYDHTVEVEKCEHAATVLALDAALLRRPRAIKHDAVPVLAGHDREQKQHGLVEVAEVLVLADDVTSRDRAKQFHSEHREHEQDDEQEQHDVGQLSDREDDRLDDGLESFQAAG